MTRPLPGTGFAGDPGFAVYVHWPFCLSKCPYCDFNSHVRFAPPDEQRFVDAFVREMAHHAEKSGPRQTSSVFFGGGTPSLMAPATVGAILEGINRHWPLAPGAEVTLEANPTSVEATRFAGYRAAGVNRVSLGVQALRDEPLKALGRLHSAQEAREAIAIARKHFDRYSFDLIHTRPDQTLADWREELRLALDEAAEHLSLYQLTIEEGTAYHTLFQAGKLVMPDVDLSRAFYDVTQEICEAAGLPAYEISNHARIGAECRHNLVYWRSGDFVGLGAGAHGRITTARQRIATSNIRSPEDWLSAVETVGHGGLPDERLTAEENGDEFLVMGLRLTEGVSPQRYAALTGHGLSDPRIDDLVREGLVRRLSNGNIAVTREGFPVLDAVVADIAMLD